MKNEPCDNCVILPICLSKSSERLISECKQLRKYIESQKGIVLSIKEEEGTRAVDIIHQLNSINRSIKVVKYFDKVTGGIMRIYYMDDAKSFGDCGYEMAYFDCD